MDLNTLARLLGRSAISGQRLKRKAIAAKRKHPIAHDSPFFKTAISYQVYSSTGMPPEQIDLFTLFSPTRLIYTPRKPHFFATRHWSEHYTKYLPVSLSSPLEGRGKTRLVAFATTFQAAIGKKATLIVSISASLRVLLMPYRSCGIWIGQKAQANEVRKSQGDAWFETDPILAPQMPQRLSRSRFSSKLMLQQPRAFENFVQRKHC